MSETFTEQAEDQNILEIEKSILSSILYHFPEVESSISIDTLSTNEFVSLPAQRVLRAIQGTPTVNGKYDPLMVMDSLKESCLSAHECGMCETYLNSLPRDISYFSVGTYLSILRQHNVKRELDRLARSILQRQLSSENFHDVIEQWKFKFHNIVSNTSLVNFLDAKQVIQDFQNLVKESTAGKRVPFLKTNYWELDKKIKALSGGQLIVIASRPGVGKTTFAINLICQNFPYIRKSGVSDRREPAIGIFSLEMTNASLVEKLIAIDAQLELNVVQKLMEGGKITEYQSELISNSQQQISDCNILFCDEANITLGKIISLIKSWAKHYDLKFVILDYLQLVNIPEDRSMSNMNQYQKIGIISRNLKTLAMDLNICIISLAQLNRKSEERKGLDKTPILSDLRESGSIEQDADIVMFLYPADKARRENDPDEDEVIDDKRTILKIAKNRHGPVGSIEFQFDKVLGTYKLLK